MRLAHLIAFIIIHIGSVYGFIRLAYSPLSMGQICYVGLMKHDIAELWKLTNFHQNIPWKYLQSSIELFEQLSSNIWFNELEQHK